ncbi:MAG: hypothetical protein AB1752_02695 [Candidatus Zixiibacteriota bacterium]
MTDMRFWGEVGLAAASRLALLAAVIWVARLVLASRPGVRTAAASSAPAAPLPAPRPAVSAALQTASTARYVDLKARPRASQAPAASSALRERLNEYIKKPAGERVGA